MSKDNQMSRDQFPSDKRSWIMSRVKSRNTTPEIRLRRELWQKGLHYRVQVKELPGKPDVIFPRAKVVVFVDGAFWHGKKFSTERLDQMSEYWRQKIRRNMARDAENNKRLETMGYLVLRFLEQEVLKNASEIAGKIEEAVKDRLKQGPSSSV